jgi:hypothetical protein
MPECNLATHILKKRAQQRQHVNLYQSMNVTMCEMYSCTRKGDLHIFEAKRLFRNLLESLKSDKQEQNYEVQIFFFNLHTY